MKTMKTLSQIEIEVLQALEIEDDQERELVLEALEAESIALLEAKPVQAQPVQAQQAAPVQAEVKPQQAAPKNDAEAVFQTLEANSNFKADLDLIRAAIELSKPVTAMQNISAEKARLTMINRANRIKRLKKFQALNESALNLVASNVEPDTLEKCAIYAQDKLIQLARFMTGETDIFGRGRNNTLMYTLRGIAVHSPKVLSTKDNSYTLTRYGQPHESAQTQSSSSLKALEAFGILSGYGRGLYQVNYESPILAALLDSIGTK